MYFSPLTLYRIYSRLHRRRLTRPLSRPLEILNFLLFHAIVPPTAQIGPGTSFEHRGIGVVVHPRAIIGSDCIVMQHVTIGGRANRRIGERSCPTIHDRVTLGAGCSVLGPIVIESDVQVGANAVVLSDVPRGALAVGVPARIKINS